MYKSNIRIDDGKASSIFKRNFYRRTSWSTLNQLAVWSACFLLREMTFLERVHHEPDAVGRRNFV